MHCLLEWASLSEVYQYHATPKCVFGSNSNFEAFSPHNLSLLFPLPFRSMISEFAVQKTRSLSRHSLSGERAQLLWVLPTSTSQLSISQTWWRNEDFLRWLSSGFDATWFWVLGKPSFKKKRNFMKKFHKTVPPPPYCFYEILIQNFDRISEYICSSE